MAAKTAKSSRKDQMLLQPNRKTHSLDRRRKGHKAPPVPNKKMAGFRDRSPSRAVAAFAEGIGSSAQFANVLSALVGDVLNGSITPEVANAACNASGKLLKLIDLQLQFKAARTGTDVLECLPSK
jgi:hypothetical protein